MKNGTKFKVITGIGFFVGLLIGYAPNRKKSNQPKSYDKAQPIAIQGAMDMEISALLEEMGDYKEEKHGTFSFFIGEITGIPVVVSRTDIGMVNAAASTTLLIEKFKPKAIINQGTAGGHDPTIHVFDTVIGTKVINIGSFVTDHRDSGQGMTPETWQHMSTIIRNAVGENVNLTTLESDPILVELARHVADKYKYGEVVEGTIGSADLWNREIDRIQWFHENFETSAEEMEAFAVAQVAKILDVPFLSLRTISNSEVSGDGIEDLETAGQYGAEFAVEVLKAIAAGM
jgi:adenosylhomocysteine nucleosidase